jgi:hypothetical protein
LRIYHCGREPTTRATINAQLTGWKGWQVCLEQPEPPIDPVQDVEKISRLGNAMHMPIVPVNSRS